MIRARSPWPTTATSSTLSTPHAPTITTTARLRIAAADLAGANVLATALDVELKPRVLLRTQALVRARPAQLRAFLGPVTGHPAARVILAGAGPSAYIGECRGPLLDRALPARVDAVPTTDIVSTPALYLVPGQPLLLVSFG